MKNQSRSTKLGAKPSFAVFGQIHKVEIGFSSAGMQKMRPEKGDGMPSKDFVRQLEGYGLTTARILYHRPDYRFLLQTFVWQDYDVWPDFPELRGFLGFWSEKLEGPLHSVTVMHARLIKPAEVRMVDNDLKFH